MKTYVTPALYRTMGYGASVDALSDAELMLQLQAASALVNRHCNQPREHDFRGGLVTDEQHVWTVSNGNAPGTQRLWPDHRPVKECSSFRIQVTNTQYLNVPVGNIFLEKTMGYLEPVIAASSIGVWSYSAIPIAGLVTPVAKINYEYGQVFNEVGEVLFPDGGAVYRASHQWWTDAPVVVYVNGGVVTPTAIDRDEGIVTLPVEIDLDDIVTLDYEHKLPWEIRDGVALVATQLLGNRAIVAAGMSGISGIKVEEIEIRQSRDSLASRQEITGLADLLLTPFRWQGFA